MLEYIRSNAQSWGVKAAFGVIILVFVFWGVGNLRDNNASAIVATVNGKPILMVDFAQAHRVAEESVRRANPSITREQLQSMQITRQVMQQMIMESLLLQEAQRLNIVVTPMQMRLAVEKMPIFQDAAGKFDPEAYKRIMSAQRQGLARFEEGIRKGLLEENLHRDLTAAAYVSPEEAHAFFNFAQEQRDIEYIFFASAAHKAPAPAEDELKAWYESNRALFAIPATVDVEYVHLQPSASQDDMDKIRERLDTLIEANILHRPLAEAAKTLGLQVQRTGPQSAESLQKMWNVTDKDAQNLMNTPAQSPVETPLEATDNSFIVARILEKISASTKEYAIVRDEVRNSVQEEKNRTAALKAAAEARKALPHDAAALPAPLTSKVVTIKGIQRGESLADLEAQAELTAALFAAPQGAWLPTAYEARIKGASGAVLARTQAVHLPADEAWQPLADMLRTTLENQRKNMMFQAFMGELLEKAKVEIKNPQYLQQMEQM